MWIFMLCVFGFGFVNLVLNLDLSLELRKLEGGSWCIFRICELNSGNRWGEATGEAKLYHRQSQASRH